MRARSAPTMEERHNAARAAAKVMVNPESNSWAEQYQVRRWLGLNVRLPEYTDKIIENGFDRMDLLGRLSVTDLEPMGITKIEHKEQIMNAISILKLVEPGSPNAAAAPVEQQGLLPPQQPQEGYYLGHCNAVPQQPIHAQPMQMAPPAYAEVPPGTPIQDPNQYCSPGQQ